MRGGWFTWTGNRTRKDIRPGWGRFALATWGRQTPLVVDVADNNDKSVFDMAGHFHSDALHVVERFTIVDKDTIDYEATFDDPKVFTSSVQDEI